MWIGFSDRRFVVAKDDACDAEGAAYEGKPQSFNAVRTTPLSVRIMVAGGGSGAPSVLGCSA